MLQALVADPVAAADLDGAAEIMKQRLAKLGVDGEVTHPVLTKHIVLRLNGVSPAAAGTIADTEYPARRHAVHVPPGRAGLDGRDGGQMSLDV